MLIIDPICLTINNCAKDIASQHICLNGEEVRKVIEKADDFTQAGERYRSLSKRRENI